jgi:hypothetical protein
MIYNGLNRDNPIIAGCKEKHPSLKTAIVDAGNSIVVSRASLLSEVQIHHFLSLQVLGYREM